MLVQSLVLAVLHAATAAPLQAGAAAASESLGDLRGAVRAADLEADVPADKTTANVDSAHGGVAVAATTTDAWWGLPPPPPAADGAQGGVAVATTGTGGWWGSPPPPPPPPPPAPPGAWCGGHRASSCAECPRDGNIWRGRTWCNGECVWLNDACIPATCETSFPAWVGDGHCDHSLNTPECGYDGGDCCEETCVETCKYKCTASFNCIGDEPSMEGGPGKATDSIVYATTEEQRDSVWLMYFFEKWGYFPVEGYNVAFEEIEAQMRENGDWEQIEEKAEAALQTGVNAGVTKGLHSLVAREIVKASVLGGKSAAGRRAAIVVVSRPVTLLAAQSSAVAFKTVASGAVGIVPIIGEYATRFTLRAFGVEDETAITYGGAVGSILGGVIAGAVVGGPVGAAIGGAVGAASWLVGQGISALFNVGQGPSDNWCYIIKGSNWQSSDDVNLYTYNKDDSLRWISYWSSNTDEFSSQKVMSAGQGQVESFQLQVGNKRFPEVYYQDTIFVGKDTCGTRMACHCGGSYNEARAGRCQCENL